jgi:hypothetical protein
MGRQDWQDWTCAAYPDHTCSASFSLSWEAAAGASGYRIYGTLYDEDCNGGITQPLGPRTLIATIGGSDTQWAGTVSFDYRGVYSIELEAFNAAGATTSHVGYLAEPVTCQ